MAIKSNRVNVSNQVNSKFESNIVKNIVGNKVILPNKNSYKMSRNPCEEVCDDE